MLFGRTQVYTAASVVLLGLWTAVMAYIFRPLAHSQPVVEDDYPMLGSLAIEQLGPKLRISYVSYSPTLELSLPGLRPNPTKADQNQGAITPSWFSRSFAINPIVSPEGKCEWDVPGASYQDKRLSMQVLAYCPLPMNQWQWDLSFLLGPLPQGSLQLILVDDMSSESITLRGRHLIFQTKRIALAMDDESESEDQNF